jgi:CxxC-x17-CxxC domain-containing protein
MGFNNEPRQGGYGRDSNTPVVMHKATCTACKKECEVPFVPTPGKDVFCKECFAKQPKKPRRY